MDRPEKSDMAPCPRFFHDPPHMTGLPSVAAASDLPRTIFIELTSCCNMHCAFCPSDVLRRPKEFLSASRLRSFLDQLHAMNCRAPIMLNVLGEPLLNKKIYPLLDELEVAGHPVTLITNMTLLGDEEVRKELLRHGNLTLAMSLQAATARLYALRGYDRLPYRAFFKIFLAVVKDKFRLQSGTRLEIHVASNFVMAHDPTIQADGGLNLWANFPNEKSELRWITRMLRQLDRLALRMKRRYTVAFAATAAAAAVKYREQIGKKIALERTGLPANFQHLKEDVFWGYMALPDVFLVFKSLELWTRDKAFLQAALPPGRMAYVEEREDSMPCFMADSFGMLANGDYVFCCLDYEGEMGLGNIDSTSVAAVLHSGKRATVRRDAMAAALCRRCRGNLFVFSTRALAGGSEQAVDKFGRGFWPREENLHGIGGRWTDGCAWAYVFARIPARRVRLSFLFDFPDEAQLTIAISPFDPAAECFFPPVASFPLQGQRCAISEFEVAFDFQAGRLYRLEIRSPFFIPDEIHGNGDRRRLGLAVFSIAILV
jgi:hypothetical protein